MAEVSGEDTPEGLDPILAAPAAASADRIDRVLPAGHPEPVQASIVRELVAMLTVPPLAGPQLLTIWPSVTVSGIPSARLIPQPAHLPAAERDLLAAQASVGLALGMAVALALGTVALVSAAGSAVPGLASVSRPTTASALVTAVSAGWAGDTPGDLALASDLGLTRAGELGLGRIRSAWVRSGPAMVTATTVCPTALIPIHPA